MTNAQTEARAIAALFDDIYVRDGFCDWADVANARDEALRLHATALAAKDAELAKFDFEKHSLKVSLARAEAQLAEADKALEPFADIAGKAWADENGWTDDACQNDRICDWFGPSDFLAARRALTGGQNG